mmetsp:Transcript_65785/g.174405  ORF Transcript_65785/g.174405 Transcript_65785/m.174405 type:complete len:186 (-) Transcript_65785:145-702(-)
MCSVWPVCCANKRSAQTGVLLIAADPDITHDHHTTADPEIEEPDENIISCDVQLQASGQDDSQKVLAADTLDPFDTLPELGALPKADMPVGTQFAVHMRKQDSKRLGVRLIQTRKTISIKRVDPGPFAEWNVSNPDKRVQLGDFVLEVNGERDKTDVMLDRLQDEWILDLIIARGTGNPDVPPPV